MTTATTDSLDAAGTPPRRDPTPFYWADPKPGLTGDSHADLEALAAWSQRHDGAMQPQGQAAAAPPLFTDAEHLRLRSAVADAIVNLGRLIGVGVVEQLRRDYDEVVSQAWTLDRLAAGQRDRVRWLERLLVDATGDRDRARDIACALEAELAQRRDASWLGVYTSLLEERVTETEREWCVGRANELAAAAPAALPDPGLPVVDDASLPERQLQFRGPAGELLAVGALDRVFGALDQATEIAVGALADVDGPDPEHPLDDLEAPADRLTWPDGTEWQRDPDGGWLLIHGVARRSGESAAGAHVATPPSDRDAGSRWVFVGASWGPYGDDVPQPAPPGPADPPRPRRHRPFA